MGRGGAEKVAYSDGRDVVRFAGKLDPEIKEVTVWLHVGSGARLKARLGRTVRGDDCDEKERAAYDGCSSCTGIPPAI